MENIKILSGFLLGLTTGITCIGICSPYLLPFLLSKYRNIKENCVVILEYLAGRFIAYIVIGFLAGVLGENLSNFKIPVFIEGIILSILSLLLVLYSLRHFSNFFHKYGRVIKLDSRVPFITGIYNGLNLCPPFITAITYVITLHSVLKGIMFFIFFFLGTSIYVIPFIFSSFLTKIQRIKNISQIAGVLIGIWFFIYGISLILK